MLTASDAGQVRRNGLFGVIRLRQHQRKRRAGGNGPPGQREQLVRDGARSDDRVAPRIGGDQLRQQLNAQAMRVAGNGVDPQCRPCWPVGGRPPSTPPLCWPAGGRPPLTPPLTVTRGHAVTSSGAGSTGGRPVRGHGPCSECMRTSASKTDIVFAARPLALSGRWHAPRPATSWMTCWAERSTSMPGRPNAIRRMHSASTGRPNLQGPHCPALCPAR
jgi:hypothetical protein